MIDHEHILDLLPAYALGALEPGEMRHVSEHLEACRACRAEFAGLDRAAAHIAFAVPSEAPPEDLRARILEQVAPQAAHAPAYPSAASPQGAPASAEPQTRPVPHLRRRLDERLRAWLWRISPALAVVGVLLIVGLSVSNILLWQRVRQEQTRAANFGVVALAGLGEQADASGILVVSRDGKEGALVVDWLKPLEPSQQYQLWLVRDGHRTSGGVFSVDDAGYAALQVYAPLPLSEYSSFGVTVEPAGGSESPTGERVLGGAFQ